MRKQVFNMQNTPNTHNTYTIQKQKQQKKHVKNADTYGVTDLPGIEPGLKAPEAYVISSYTTDPIINAAIYKRINRFCFYQRQIYP